jgi:hypothetical protein
MDAVGVIVLILFYLVGIVVIAGSVLSFVKCVPFVSRFAFVLDGLKSSSYGAIVYYAMLAGVVLSGPYALGVLIAISAGVFS